MLAIREVWSAKRRVAELGAVRATSSRLVQRNAGLRALLREVAITNDCCAVDGSTAKIPGRQCFPG